MPSFFNTPPAANTGLSIASGNANANSALNNLSGPQAAALVRLLNAREALSGGADRRRKYGAGMFDFFGAGAPSQSIGLGVEE